MGSFVSGDSKYAAVVGLVEKDADEFELYRRLKKLAAKVRGPEEVHLAGLPVLRAVASRNMKTDMRRFIPFVLLIAILILYLSFRTLKAVILIIATVLMSVLSTVGLMGHLNKPFMLVNNILPAILIAVGTAYGIHVLARYYEEIYASGDKRKVLLKTIEDVGTPVLMAGLTTMAGFISLAASPLPVIFDFGLFAAFGIFLALLFSLTMIPAFLILLPLPQRREHLLKPGLLDRILKKFGQGVTRARYPLIGAGILLAIFFSFGIPQINLEMNPLKFFNPEDEIRKADAVINKYLGGSVNMNLLIKGDIESPEVLNQMEAVEHFLERFPETGHTLSINTIIKKINRALHANDPQFETIPQTKNAVAQAILLYSMSASPEDFEKFVDNNFENAQIIARMKSVSTRKIARISQATEDYCLKNLSDNVQFGITGFSVFLKELARMVISGQIRSIILSIFIVFLIAWATYRSFPLGLLAVIPVTIAIIINFGLMGLSGIDLSIPAALISSIIIGVGIDYSFHFISRYRLELKKEGETHPLTRTIQTVGKPILYNAFSVGCGFLILLVSGFLPIRFVGWLIALAMFACAFGTLTILAAALGGLKSQRRT